MGLKNTFNSVVEQTRFENVEYMIIDGGSKDGSKEFLEENGECLSYWQSEKDNGIWDAMNIGLSKANGEYILFLNSGDSLYTNSIIDQMLIKYKPDVDVFYGDTMFVDQGGDELGLISDKTSKKLPSNLVFEDFINGMVVCHQSYVVRRNLISEYSPVYKYVADFDWMINSVKKAKVIVNLNCTMSNFLIGGFSTDNKIKSNIERLKILYINFGLWATIKIQCKKILSKIFI